MTFPCWCSSRITWSAWTASARYSPWVLKCKENSVCQTGSETCVLLLSPDGLSLPSQDIDLICIACYLWLHCPLEFGERTAPKEINCESPALMLRKSSVCCAAGITSDSFWDSGGCLQHLGAAAVQETEMPGKGGALSATAHGLESLVAVADTRIISCEREGTSRY